MWKLIGISAAILTMFGFVPQVIKILKNRSAKDISLITLLQFICGVSLWTAYGFYLKDTIIIVANSVTLVSLIAALALYVRYR